MPGHARLADVPCSSHALEVRDITTIITRYFPHAKAFVHDSRFRFDLLKCTQSKASQWI